jgi:hypothetical protein
MGQITIANKIVIGKPEGKRQFRISKPICEDNIAIDPKNKGEVVNWIEQPQQCLLHTQQ